MYMAPGLSPAPVGPRRGGAHPGPAQLSLPHSQPPGPVFPGVLDTLGPSFQALLHKQAPVNPFEGPGARMGLQQWGQQVAVQKTLVHHLTSPGCPWEGGGTGPVVPICPQAFPAEEVPGAPHQIPTCHPRPMSDPDVLSPALPRRRGPSGEQNPVWTLCGRKGKGLGGSSDPQGRARPAQALRGGCWEDAPSWRGALYL